MADFGIRFFLCNIFICIIIGFLLMAKRALKHSLTSRMQFHLWFLLLGHKDNVISQGIGSHGDFALAVA